MYTHCARNGKRLGAHNLPFCSSFFFVIVVNVVVIVVAVVAVVQFAIEIEGAPSDMVLKLTFFMFE